MFAVVVVGLQSVFGANNSSGEIKSQKLRPQMRIYLQAA